MMGTQKNQPSLFSYQINLDKRVRADNPLRKLKEVADFSFVRAVGQCVTAGLVDGKKIHLDSSLNDENASCDSVLNASPELIAALKAAYQAVESKLDDATTPSGCEAVNDRVVSTTDADAAVVRRAQQPSRPCYQNHRVVDDARCMITTVETTPGSIAENKRLLPLVDQHEANTGAKVETAVADHKYGTTENFVACAQRDIRTHLGDMRAKQHHARSRGIFPDSLIGGCSWCCTPSSTARAPFADALAAAGHRPHRGRHPQRQRQRV